jgi:hypothetical protein
MNPNTGVGISAAESPIMANTSTTLTVTESNAGDTQLSNPYVNLVGGTLNLTLNSGSDNFSGDTNNNNKLDLHEIWQWTNISTGSLSVDTQFTATGHGTDPLGKDITASNGYPNEEASVTVETTTIVPPVPELPAGLLFGLGLTGLGGFVVSRKLKGASAAK